MIALGHRSEEHEMGDVIIGQIFVVLTLAAAAALVLF